MSLTETMSGRIGLHADVSANAATGWYLGDGREVSLDTLLGFGVDGSVDAGPAGVGGWTSQDSEYGSVQWIGYSGGMGLGAGGSVGVGVTAVVTINGVHMRLNF